MNVNGTVFENNDDRCTVAYLYTLLCIICNQLNRTIVALSLLANRHYIQIIVYHTKHSNVLQNK